MELKKVGDFLTESKISGEDDIHKRLTVKLNLKGIYPRDTNAIEKEGATKQFIRKSGQFIYGKQNLFKGAFGIIPKHLDGYLSSSDIPSFDFNDKINSKWFFYYFSRKNFYQKLENLSTGTGSKRVSPKDFLKIMLYIPPLDEQEKIADFLYLVDKKIELMEKKYEKVIQFKKSILEKIFKKELNFKNNEWITIKLKDIGQFYRGHSYNSSNVTQRGLLVLRSNNIKNNKISLSEQLQFVNKDCKEELKLKKGDIVICMSNGSRNLVGKTGQYMGNYDGNLTVGAFCSIFRPKLGLSKFLFQTESYKKQLYLILAGTNINNLKNSDLENFSFEIPIGSDEIDNICSFLDYIDSNIYSLEKKIEKIKEFKKYLLQQMFV